MEGGDLVQLSFRDRVEDEHFDSLCALYQSEWWSRDRSRDEIRRMLSHSDLIFVVLRFDEVVGFARVLTDRVFKALILDVIVALSLRGQGIGRLLMERVLAHPELAEVRHMELYCLPEMRGFYRRWGFSHELGELGLMRRQARVLGAGEEASGQGPGARGE